MSKNIVVVESPAKAKTIKKYLGNDFSVLASYGHVRDLLPKSGSVNPEHDFEMHYDVIQKNAKHIDAIRKALKSAEALYLAPDPDREGEAIAWHIYQILQEKGALKSKAIHRVSFNQITKAAVQDAVAHPRNIDMNLVDAQQARRALDYLVGFTLSPLLWKKIQRGLSAGRVQSPALRLIVEREEEIEKFKPQEYWTLTANCSKESVKADYDSLEFKAKLIEYQGEKLKQFSITDAQQAKSAKELLLKAANGKLEVVKVEKKQKKRHPLPPFTTSTLQQEASQKLGFTTKRTMMVAQKLYEGIDVGEGAVGLITYMRTDSYHLAPEALSEIREVIHREYGKENLPEKPNFYKTKSKNAQEAHEAIRPTSVSRTPESVKHALTLEQYKLYDLIWKRTIASQMIYALIDTVSVDFNCGDQGIFRSTGSVVVKPGFLSVYEESTDDGDKGSTRKSSGNRLPVLKEGDKVFLRDILDEQHFTEPPPRYSEASLVKTLEEYGIGRPSTYASIISTLQQRQYAILEKKRFHPTDVGRIVNKFLTQYFTQYVDYDFTAQLEDELDEVSRGEKAWLKLLKVFWKPFHQKIQEIDQSVKRSDVTQEALDEKCPECGKPLSIRLGRSGRFIGCTGYPECKYTRNLDSSEEQETVESEIVEGRSCPKCDSALVIKQGRYGKFIGCSNYPKCKFIESLNKPKDTGVTCPECYKGTLLQRRSKRGKIFYSCSDYPTCKYATWNEPIAERCPKCGWPILTLKTTKKRGTEKICPQKNCDYIKKT